MTAPKGKDWSEYWDEAAEDKGLYAVIAKFYRRSLISRAVHHYFRRYFADDPGKVYLHAGCGSGESDNRIGFKQATFVLLDLSPEALRIARARTTLPNVHLVAGDIFRPPFRPASIDGLWNLGVMEHFHEPEISRIFEALGPALKPNARCLIFWPPHYGTSVVGLNALLFVTNRIFRRRLQLQPDEVARYWSKGWAQRLMRASGLVVERSHFSWRDFWTYVILVVTKPGRS